MLSVTVRFGDAERSNDEITANWIEQQVRVRQRDGQLACAAVRIEGDGVNVALAAGDCPPGRGSGREANSRELEVIELWRRRHLGDGRLVSGALEAFVRQVQRL